MAFYDHCTVRAAGPSPDNVVKIWLKGPSFDCDLRADPGVNDWMLRVALTAISTGKKVQVGMEGDKVNADDTIKNLYLEKG
ncbi:hypothetical protein [Nocardia fluminea]|uniref:hypothetical protein n=1 Tax=Nocardia fluminea TaxID=134984 RepID=UPI003D118D09